MEVSVRRRATRATGIGIAVATVLVVALAFLLGRGPIADALERIVGVVQNTITARLGDTAILRGWHLYAIAFIGGLISSFSPCILGMLPVNLSYIGAAGLRSRRAAVVAASTFVLGVVVVNAALGLASSLFFAVFIQGRAT